MGEDVWMMGRTLMCESKFVWTCIFWWMLYNKRIQINRCGIAVSQWCLFHPLTGNWGWNRWLDKMSRFCLYLYTSTTRHNTLVTTEYYYTSKISVYSRYSRLSGNIDAYRHRSKRLAMADHSLHLLLPVVPIGEIVPWADNLVHFSMRREHDPRHLVSTCQSCYNPHRSINFWPCLSKSIHLWICHAETTHTSRFVASFP